MFNFTKIDSKDYQESKIHKKKISKYPIEHRVIEQKVKVEVK